MNDKFLLHIVAPSVIKILDPLSSPLARRKKYQKFLEGLKITTKPQLIKMIGESRVLGNITKDTTIKCMAEIENLQ